jgi:hypothetical protein
MSGSTKVQTICIFYSNDDKGNVWKDILSSVQKFQFVKRTLLFCFIRILLNFKTNNSGLKLKQKNYSFHFKLIKIK